MKKIYDNHLMKHVGKFYCYNDLDYCDVAYIRMALKDSVELMQNIYDKFIKQKRPKKMIKGAKKNLDWATEKLCYFEDKLNLQDEWLKKNFDKAGMLNGWLID